MKLKELEPDVRATFEETIDSTFASITTEHVMAIEEVEGVVLFIDTERGRDKGIVILSHEELILLVWETVH